MGIEKTLQAKAPSRREVLKKAGVASAFIIPTITTYTIADLAQAASPANGDDSGPPPPPV